MLNFLGAYPDTLAGKAAAGDGTLDLHLPFKESLDPAYRDLVATAKTMKPNATQILDICSRLGEPACSLARTFPDATVKACDESDAMVQKTQALAAELRVKLEACTMEMGKLTLVESGSQDIVVAAFGLIYTTDHARVLREVQRVLKPGGLFLGAVWQEEFPLAELIIVTMGRVIQRVEAARKPAKAVDPDAEEKPIPRVKLAPPIDPLALANADALDSVLATAGFTLSESHNASAKLDISLGQAYGGKTWKVACAPVFATLETLQKALVKMDKRNHSIKDVFSLTKATFDQAALPHVVRGRVILPSAYRKLVAFKPARTGTPAAGAQRLQPASTTLPPPPALASGDSDGPYPSLGLSEFWPSLAEKRTPPRGSAATTSSALALVQRNLDSCSTQTLRTMATDLRLPGNEVAARSTLITSVATALLTAESAFSEV